MAQAGSERMPAGDGMGGEVNGIGPGGVKGDLHEGRLKVTAGGSH